MQEPSEVWHEGELEFLHSDDGVPSISKGSNNNPTLYTNLNYHRTVKPLLNGFLTGELHALLNYGLRSIVLPMAQSDPDFKKKLPKSVLEIPNITRLKMDVLTGAIHTTAALGLFEILTNKLRNANNGMPLTLYQEAWCGLTSGAAAVFVWQPFLMARNRAGIQSLTYSNWFSTLSHIVRNEGVLTLWRGSGMYMGTQAVAHMGMLASYKPSRDYLIESRGLSDQTAQICASAISGFFSAVCYHPCDYLIQIKAGVQKQYAAGDKNAYRYIPHYASRVLGSSQFYLGFLKAVHANALFCMIRWGIYERVARARP
ncbi:hypothetical protein ACS0TY_006491 [Phlomoides rotata]